jgi:hypothetical protein
LLLCFAGSGEKIRFFFQVAHATSMSLAQRWEKPSTAHEERKAILRARRLCEEKVECKMLGQDSDENPDSPSNYADGERDQRISQIRSSNTFLVFAWLLGVRRSIITSVLQMIPGPLFSAVCKVEAVLSRTVLSSYQNQLAATSTIADTFVSNEITLMYRLNPDTMEKVCVESTPEFGHRIAGMTREEFQLRMESEDFPLPCSPLQYISYFIDGAVCLGEGLNSWTRSCSSLNYLV